MNMNNSKLQICMLGHKHIPSREGGVEIVVEELSTRMANLGYSITCFNRRSQYVGIDKSDSINCKTYKGVKIIPVWTFDKKGLAALTSSISASFLASFGHYNVVHYHAEGPCAMLWLPKLFGKRCVATIHGLDWAREKWKGGLGSKYIKFGEKVAVKHADQIIVLSKNVQDYFWKTYSRKTVYIPNGVNQPVILEAKEIYDRWNLKKDQYYLFLGRLVPEKGLKYLVKAFMESNINKKLVIAGGASDSNDFAKELHDITLNDNRIIYTGFVEGNTLEELYSNAYVYVLPSDLEGMPISLLEAMSYDNCCLVSDIPECLEVVEDQAIVFKHGNCEDLKAKLLWCDNHPDEINQYKQVASAFVCKKYNWDEVVDKTLKLYKQNLI